MQILKSRDGFHHSSSDPEWVISPPHVFVFSSVIEIINLQRVIVKIKNSNKVLNTIPGT